jgi:prepilin peptidase CpaA
MQTQEAIWFLALSVGMTAGWTDWKTRRIPNWLTIPALFLGIVAHGLTAGRSGLLESLKGTGLALLILLPVVLLRGLGGGDWKLMGALGAILGFRMMLVVLWGAVVIAGVMGVVQITRHRRWRATWNNLRELLWSFYSLRWGVHPKVNLDNPEMRSVPFGTATALSLAICFALARF